jgi:tyrosinase
VLDGSLLSMGGNGIKEGGCPNQTFYGIPTNDAPVIKIPRSGQNGGCVTSGPFKDWSVNIGPGLTGLSCDPPNPNNNFTDPSFGLDYNPRCLKRDISSWASSRYSNDEMVTKLLKSEDIKTFWSDLQGTSTTGGGPFETGMGVHTAGHFTVAGTASDFLASPIDPYFYFHHSAIDRAWFTWQNMNPANRTDAIYGTIVISDPTAPDTKLTDTMTLGHAYPGSLTVGEAMSTMNGLFCYTYV